MELRFAFTAELWEWTSNATSWVFATLPVDDGEDIREFVPTTRGFGSVRVEVQVGETTWRTSVFPSKETGSYVLPVKKAVRSKEALEIGDDVEFDLTVLMVDA